MEENPIGTPPLPTSRTEPAARVARRQASPLSLQTSLGLSVGRPLRPTGGWVLKVLLAPIGCRVKEVAGVRECFGATRIDRVGVEHIVVEDEENAEAVLLTLHCVGAVPCL